MKPYIDVIYHDGPAPLYLDRDEYENLDKFLKDNMGNDWYVNLVNKWVSVELDGDWRKDMPEDGFEVTGFISEDAERFIL